MHLFTRLAYVYLTSASCQARDVLMAETDGVPGSLRFTEEGRQSERVKDMQTDGCRQEERAPRPRPGGRA